MYEYIEDYIIDGHILDITDCEVDLHYLGSDAIRPYFDEKLDEYFYDYEDVEEGFKKNCRKNLRKIKKFLKEIKEKTGSVFEIDTLLFQEGDEWLVNINELQKLTQSLAVKGQGFFLTICCTPFNGFSYGE